MGLFHLLIFKQLRSNALDPKLMITFVINSKINYMTPFKILTFMMPTDSVGRIMMVMPKKGEELEMAIRQDSKSSTNSSIHPILHLLVMSLIQEDLLVLMILGHIICLIVMVIEILSIFGLMHQLKVIINGICAPISIIIPIRMHLIGFIPK